MIRLTPHQPNVRIDIEDSGFCSLMHIFDVFIAVDFSGSKNLSMQRRHIAFAETEHGLSACASRVGLTRSEAACYLLERLRHHDSRGKRVLCGFDFQYSFPLGFWHALTGLQEIWTEMIKGMLEGVAGLPGVDEEPVSNARHWADVANREMSRRLSVSIGPFWGPNFPQAKDPGFFHSHRPPFEEYRLVEQRLKGCKPIFRIGGQGSVGLQSLCGIPHLSRIREICSQQSIPLHFWPFDGWGSGGHRHFLVEWYPAIYNRGQKSDEKDACACVEWAKEMDQRAMLRDYFAPRLSDSARLRAAFEGWILGVME